MSKDYGFGPKDPSQLAAELAAVEGVVRAIEPTLREIHQQFMKSVKFNAKLGKGFYLTADKKDPRRYPVWHLAGAGWGETPLDYWLNEPCEAPTDYWRPGETEANLRRKRHELVVHWDWLAFEKKRAVPSVKLLIDALRKNLPPCVWVWDCPDNKPGPEPVIVVGRYAG